MKPDYVECYFIITWRFLWTPRDTGYRTVQYVVKSRQQSTAVYSPKSPKKKSTVSILIKIDVILSIIFTISISIFRFSSHFPFPLGFFDHHRLSLQRAAKVPYGHLDISRRMLLQMAFEVTVEVVSRSAVLSVK
jgi:hypothetical protein